MQNQTDGARDNNGNGGPVPPYAQNSGIGAEAGGLMTVGELAIFLHLSQAKVYRMAQAGQVPAIRIGRSWRFRRERIDLWLNQGVPTAK